MFFKLKSKSSLIITSSIIVCFLFSFLFVAFAYVNDPNNIDSGIARLAYVWAEDIFDSDFINEVEDIVKIYVTVDDFGVASSTSPSGSNTKYHLTLWNVAQSVYDSIKVVGMGFVTLYFLIGLMDRAQSEQFNVEHFFKAMLKYSVTLIFVINGFTLFGYVINLGNALLTTIDNAINLSPTITGVETLLNAYYARCQDKSFFLSDVINGLSILLELCIPYLCMFLAKIILKVLVYSRLVELFIRAAFMPIGISDMFNGNGNGTGVRYIKKLLGTAFQGSMIMAILSLYKTLLAGVSNSGLSSPIEVIVITFAIISLVMKSQQWANEILGV